MFGNDRLDTTFGINRVFLQGDRARPLSVGLSWSIDLATPGLFNVVHGVEREDAITYTNLP
jgi:hypothetical protein